MRAIYRGNAADCITGSPFREIFVVTAREPGHRRCVPLRVAFLVAEVFALQTMFKAFYSESLATTTPGEYLRALARYLAGRFERLEYETDDSNALALVFASVAVSYGRKGAGLDIRDISFDSADRRKRLNMEVGGPLDGAFGTFVAQKRLTFFCCAPIQFDAYERETDGE
ncbi:MAG: hypothetical protein ABSG86_28735 [Thermoguttaceae bacterium]|jgi:hypothetical protein